MLKKIVLLSSIILSGLALIASLYFLFFHKSHPVFQSTTPPPTTIQIPTVISKNIIFTSKTPYISAILGPDNRRIRYFDQSSQLFMEAEFSGQNPVKLLDTKWEKNLSEVIWSPDKSKAIAALDVNGAKQYQLINFTTGEKINFATSQKAFIFSPASDQIAYNFLDHQKGINKIEIADIFGKNWREISKVRIQDVVLQWPQNDKLAISSLSSASNPSPLIILDIASGELTRIIPESLGLETLWSPKGDKVIYSSVDKNGQGPMLKMAEIGGGIIKDFKIATFAKKCTWSADNINIFCAVPTYWPEKLILPDAYWRGLFSSDDQIVKINTTTGEETLVFSPSDHLPDIQNLFSEPHGEYLFFTNKKDGLFYAISLK